jgi:endoribonuclease LACTB2
MLEIIAHDDVTEWRFSSWLGRAVNYRVSTFLTCDQVLVDAAMPRARREFAALVSRTTIRGAMVTHAHEDHAGNVEHLAAKRIPLWIAPNTHTRLTDVPRIRTYRRVVWGSMPSLRTTIIPFTPDNYVPIFTPGHSPDHHAIWHARSRTLFSGDLFLGVSVRIAQHDEDPWALVASLERAIELKPTRMFDAHRGLVRDAEGALRAKLTRNQEWIADITRAIHNGDSDQRILTTLLGGEAAIGYASRREYSRMNFVRAVRRRVQPAE